MIRENCKNDREFYPENIELASAMKDKKETIDIRVWTSGDILVTCVI